MALELPHEDPFLGTGKSIILGACGRTLRTGLSHQRHWARNSKSFGCICPAKRCPISTDKFLALDENFKRVLGMIPDARNSPRYDSVMGLEDELEARYPVLRRPSGYAEAERLVGETLTLFSEAARVLAKYDVPTETLARRRPKPEGFFKRFVFDERPKPMAEGWRLCQRFGSDALWVDTYGTPWVTTSYSRESDVQNFFADWGAGKLNTVSQEKHRVS